MPVVRLTAAMIPGLQPKDEIREEVYRDSICRGLLVEAHPSGVKTFVAWGYVKGEHGCRVRLGRWRPGVFTLADARDAARAELHKMALGINPNEEKRRAKAAGTVANLFDSFLADAKTRLRPRSYTAWKDLLKHERPAARTGAGRRVFLRC